RRVARCRSTRALQLATIRAMQQSRSKLGTLTSSSAASTMHQAAATAATVEPGPPEGNAAVLRLSGRLDVYSVAAIWDAALAALTAHPRAPLIIDARNVEYCDGAGIALLVELLRRPRPTEAAVSVRGLQERFQRLLQQFDPHGVISRHTAPAT